MSMLKTIKKLLDHPQISGDTAATGLLRVIDPEGDLNHLLEPLLAGKRLEKFTGREWVDVVVTRLPNYAGNYRVKPETVKIGDMEINAPYREAPPIGTIYFTPNGFQSILFSRLKWEGDSEDLRALEAGLIFKTAEDALAAQKAISKLMRGAE